MFITRKMALDVATLDREARTIEGVSISSETPITHMIEGVPTPVVLRHAPEAISTDGKNQIPLTIGHDTSQQVGVIRSLKIDGDKLRGSFFFSRSQRGTEMMQDIQDGIITDTSIEADVMTHEDRGDYLEVTSWIARAASLVGNGADQNVGINRSEEKTMTDETGKPETKETGATGQVVDFEKTFDRSVEVGKAEGMKLERARVAGIETAFDAWHSKDGVADLKRQCIDKGATVEQAQTALLRHLGGQNPAISPVFEQTENSGASTRNESVSAGTTDRQKMAQGITDALLFRCNVKRDGKTIDVSNNPYISMTMMEQGKALMRDKRRFTGRSRNDIAGMILQRDITETAFTDATTDYPFILEDVANQVLQQAWNEAPETWRMWCDTGSVPDFKTINLPSRSGFPTIQTVAENGEFQNASFAEGKETAVAVTKGAIWSVTRQVLINDALGAFQEAGTAMGLSAARAVGDDVYAKLTTIYNMRDGSPLFGAGRNNVYAAGAPGVDTVDAIRVGMGTQTDENGITVGIRPAYLICPLSYEGTASTLRNSQYDPDTADNAGNTGGNRVNWVAGTFDVVAEHRLDADVSDPTNWFMAAAPGRTIRVYFLDGRQAPYLERRDGFRIDGMEMKVRLDYGVAVLDFRGLALNGTAPI